MRWLITLTIEKLRLATDRHRAVLYCLPLASQGENALTTWAGANSLNIDRILDSLGGPPLRHLQLGRLPLNGRPCGPGAAAKVRCELGVGLPLGCIVGDEVIELQLQLVLFESLVAASGQSHHVSTIIPLGLWLHRAMIVMRCAVDASRARSQASVATASRPANTHTQTHRSPSLAGMRQAIKAPARVNKKKVNPKSATAEKKGFAMHKKWKSTGRTP